MGQVPKYGVMGDGRLARHLLHYFSLLHMPCQQWSRRSDSTISRLSVFVEACDVIFIALSDDAIIGLIESHHCLQNLSNHKILVHGSGAKVIPGVFGMHPLMSFSDTLYDLCVYERIPFVIDQEAPWSFSTLFPLLKNPHYKIPQKDKAYYHALCVISGNFTVLLWQHFLMMAEEHWQWPESMMMPYLESIFKNLCTNPMTALTGPLVRGDRLTLLKNQHALNEYNDPFSSVYASMIKAYHEEKNSESTDVN